MSPPFLFLPQLLPKSSVPLGSLVCSLLDPHVDILKPQGAIDNEAGFQTTALSLSAFLQESQSTRFSAALTQLLKINAQPGAGSGIYLESKAVKRYELGSHRRGFSELCTGHDAREWLEEGVKMGEKCYFVVGVMTVLNAEVSQVQSKCITTGADLTAPVSTVLTGGADFGIIDPGVGAEWNKRTDEGVHFQAPGEMIWAIAYRRVKFQSFKRKSVDSAFLDQAIHWKPLMVQRARDVGDEEELGVELDNIETEDEEELVGFSKYYGIEFIGPR